MGFWSQYWHVFVFYAAVIVLIYINRSKFEFQAKFIAIYRKNWGIKFMKKIGENYSSIVNVLAYIGIWFGFIGMIVILGFLVQGVYNLFFVPDAAPIISPVLPGAKIPGTHVNLPLIQGLLALFLVVVVHEASHGIVSFANKIKVKSSGFVLFGPIPGAFVEPDEKVMVKKPHKVQHAIFAAGPFSNILLALVFFGVSIGFPMLVGPALNPSGMTFSEVAPDSAASEINLPPDVTYTLIDGEELDSAVKLIQVLQEKEVGDPLVLGTETESYELTLGQHPEDPEKPRIGILGTSTVFKLEQTSPILFKIIQFIQETFFWIFVISFGLGMANLLPLGAILPTDGSRMMQLVFQKWKGKEKGNLLWMKIGHFILIVVIILLIAPLIMSLL